jgi:fumarate reductase flavoprotein subunit
MNLVKEFDVLIIGAGLSGLMTACICAKEGLDVLVLESSFEKDYLCNSRLTGGIFHLAFHGLYEDETAIYETAMKVTDGFADQALLNVIVEDAKRAVDILQSLGIPFIRNGGELWQGRVLAPPVLPKLDRQWKGRAGDIMLRTLEVRLTEFNGSILRGHRVDKILMKDGNYVGLSGEINRSNTNSKSWCIYSKSVVIADGGFQANLHDLRKYISPYPQNMVQRNAKTGVGDGIRIAKKIGASLIGLDKFYGHVLSRDALHNDQLWPYPWVDELSRSCIVLNPQGERFVDEGFGGVHIANALAKLSDPASAIVVFDHEAWLGPARQRALSTNPFLVKAGGTVWSALNLEELALLAGVPAVSLARSITLYNAAIDSENLHLLIPSRSNQRYPALKIQKPPFYAIPVSPGITYTMGGIKIDSFSRVLDDHDKVISGVYAVGSTTGGLEGGEMSGYIGGLCKAAVTGLRAGEHIINNLKVEN